MNILSWIVVGLIAGWLAEQFVRGARLGSIALLLLIGVGNRRRI